MDKAIWKNIFPFLQWWPLVNQQTTKSDLLAGITGAIIVLPQGVAFALIAGMPPIYGLYTAMITPIVAALFGSSHHLVSGPTTTISFAVFTSISVLAQPYSSDFISLVLTLTVIVGVIQFLFGLAKLGILVNFVSRSVVTGYTAGAALFIVTNQIKHIIELPVSADASVTETWGYIVGHLQEINIHTFIVGIGTLAIALLSRKFFPRLPHFLIAMIFGAGLAHLISTSSTDIPLVGVMPEGLPPFHLPQLNGRLIQELAPSAFAIAAIGLIEVVSISRSIAIFSKQRLNSNQEFIGLGLSNLVGGFFSCYAASGSFTRSGLNYSAGARTPMAAIFAGLFLMLIMFFVIRLAAYLPYATMGGIIMLVAYNLIDFRYIKNVLKTSRTETTVLLITLFSTLFIGLVFAIFAGIISSLVLYLMRTSKPKVVVLAPNTIQGQRKFMDARLNHLETCPQLHIIRIDGSLFFGAVENIRNILYKLTETKKHILIIGNGINFIDLSGAELLESEALRLKSEGGALYLSHLKRSVREFLDKGYKEKIGHDHFFYSKEDAISFIYSKLDANICKTCTARIFNECNAEQP